MKKLLFPFLLILATAAYAADVKISSLSLGAASTTGASDSFPYVQSSTDVTKRLQLWDLINLPPLVSTYAPKANAVFTGTTTSPSFIGPLTGNASTASALAANPTDCSSGEYASAIAANGNLTCSAVTTSQLSGTVGISQGGTGQVTKAAAFNALSPMSTVGDLVYGGASGTGTRLASGTTGQVLQTNTGAAPSWSTATYPSSTTANQILYSSATNTVSGLASAATSALVTNSSSVPSLVSGTTPNRVLRTDGTTVSFGQVVDGDVAASAAVARSKLASGTVNHVVINDGSGVISSEATLAKTRGGTAQDNSSLTFPTTGTVPAYTPTVHGVVISGSGAAASVTGAGTANQVLTSNGPSADPTFQAVPAPTAPRSEVWVYTATGTGGVGSTNTAIRRWATTGINTGSAITYADSATNGGSFTINTTGIYAITHCFQFAGQTVGGISLNSNQLTTNIDAITAANRMISSFSIGTNAGTCVAVTANLVATDVVRGHITVGAGVGSTTVEDSFRITQVNF